MKTLVVRLEPSQGPCPEIERLARIVDEGGLVAIPTETVYGIAVSLRDQDAMRRLYRVKGRPADRPLTVHLGSADALHAHVPEPDTTTRKLVARYWPGPLTLVVPDRFGRPTGFRVPDLRVTQSFLSTCKTRIGCPSANPTGMPPPRSADEVLEHFDGLIDAVLDAGPARHGTSSTVVRVDDGKLEILREGVVPPEELAETAARVLLFVDGEDTYEAPLAAALARRDLARRLDCDVLDLAAHGYRVVSAGTGALRDRPATAEARAVADDLDLDLTSHRSTPLTPTLAAGADRLYLLDPSHRETILAFAPEAAPQTFPLHRAGTRTLTADGHGMEAAHRLARELTLCLEDRAQEL